MHTLIHTQTFIYGEGFFYTHTHTYFLATHLEVKIWHPGKEKT